MQSQLLTELSVRYVSSFSQSSFPRYKIVHLYSISSVLPSPFRKGIVVVTNLNHRTKPPHTKIWAPLYGRCRECRAALTSWALACTCPLLWGIGLGRLMAITALSSLIPLLGTISTKYMCRKRRLMSVQSRYGIAKEVRKIEII